MKLIPLEHYDLINQTQRKEFPTATLTVSEPPPISASTPLKPFGLGPSLLLFGLPAAIMALSVYGLTPVFYSLGLSIGDARGFAGMVVMVGLLIY
jgi:hypothetical protein